MILKTLRLFVLVPLLFSSPLLAQSRISPAAHTINSAIKFKWVALLEDYQNRFLKDQLTWAEFQYAKEFVCPVLPPPPGQPMHLCNSSVVGTSDQDPNDFVMHSEVIKQSICLICIFGKR